MVSNIFFFLFILFLFKINQKKIFLKKNFILLGVLSGLSFTSVFHHFILEQVSLLVFLIYKFKSQIIKKLKLNISCVFSYIVSFILISVPFLVNVYFSEPHFLCQDYGIQEFGQVLDISQSGLIWDYEHMYSIQREQDQIQHSLYGC